MTENTDRKYGYSSIILHWLMAIALILLYFSGDYMVTLDYYDSWYHLAPELHKSFGIVVGLLMLFRFILNKSQGHLHVLSAGGLINIVAYLVHHLFYLLVLLLVITGYLITTAKGQGIDVFGLFTVPALIEENIETGEFSGQLHDLLASVFMLLLIAHTLAALYHHFIIRDNTLKSMLGQENKSHGPNKGEIK